MSTFRLPLTNVPQRFIIALGGTEYNLTCRYNDAVDAGWVFDLADLNNVSIVANIPLVVGADLLAGLQYLGILGQLFVYTEGNQFVVPTLENLGVESNVYFETSLLNG